VTTLQDAEQKTENTGAAGKVISADSVHAHGLHVIDVRSSMLCCAPIVLAQDKERTPFNGTPPSSVRAVIFSHGPRAGDLLVRLPISTPCHSVRPKRRPRHGVPQAAPQDSRNFFLKRSAMSNGGRAERMLLQNCCLGQQLSERACFSHCHVTL